MNKYEEICFELISYAGLARSLFIESLRHAKDGDRETFLSLMEEGNDNLIKAEKVHASMISEEANDNHIEFRLILMHAEDLMMSADTIKILVEELAKLL